MRLTVNGRNINITQALRDYVEEKIGRITKHNDQIRNVEITLSVIKNPSVSNNQSAEVSCSLNGAKIHLAEESESMYASIDLLADKFDRQVKKHKDKLKGKSGSGSIRISPIEEQETEPEEEELTPDEDIIEIDLKTEKTE